MGKVVSSTLFCALFLLLTSSSEGLICYVGQEYRTSSSAVRNYLPSRRLHPQTCAYGNECHIVDATVTSTLLSSLSVHVRVGQCVSSLTCREVNCAAIGSTIAGSLSGYGTRMSSCCAACCSTDNCNKASARSLDRHCLRNSVTSLPMIPTSSPRLTSTRITSPEWSRLICQVGQEFSSTNAAARKLLPTTKLRSQTCLQDEECYIMDATTTVSNYYTSVSVNVRVGQCAKKDNCRTLTCEKTVSDVSEMTRANNARVSSCCAACCDSNNCNRVAARTVDPQCLGSSVSRSRVSNIGKGGNNMASKSVPTLAVHLVPAAVVVLIASFV